MTSPNIPAQVIADNLAALPHPDGSVHQLAGYQPTLLPEPLAAQVRKTALEIGESIVHLLKVSGWEVVPAGGTPAPVEQDDRPPVGVVWCNECDAELLRLNLSDPARIMASAPNLCAVFGARGCVFPKCRRIS